ncbi:hypothetical protein [Aestuariivivens insulae]|uniref:hypothetical protein n=1 Tax=Aestuariivivens insulae TaxID=1621988 RepID=UPI001F59C719|nr:hypothetical protein [Aestuariivivens insulae]
MKTIKQQTCLSVILLSILILFQSCTVYRSKSSTLEQVSNTAIKSKVETHNGVSIKFKYIVVENGNYYGVRKVKGKMEKMKLSEDYIKSVKQKDKTMSTVLTIALPVAIIAAVGLIFQDAFKWKHGASKVEWNF